MTQSVAQEQVAAFLRRCKQFGLAATHQRVVIYRILAESKDHPSPETVYERVRREIPSISPATVYKNIHTFLEMGVLREVSDLHQTSRLDPNLERHHHLICVRCKMVVDYYDERLDRATPSIAEPLGFQPIEHHVELRGLCPRCRAETQQQTGD